MGVKDAILVEFDHEMGSTRRLLARVPMDDFGWKPHEKSRSLGELCRHLVWLPLWTPVILESPGFDLASGIEQPAADEAPASVAALLAEFDDRVMKTRQLIGRQPEGAFDAAWTLRDGTREVFTLPRLAAFRTFVMNHLIHHRGQLTVYLRMRGVSLPPVYGPTADGE